MKEKVERTPPHGWMEWRGDKLVSYDDWQEVVREAEHAQELLDDLEEARNRQVGRANKAEARVQELELELLIRPPDGALEAERHKTMLLSIRCNELEQENERLKAWPSCVLRFESMFREYGNREPSGRAIRALQNLGKNAKPAGSYIAVQHEARIATLESRANCSLPRLNCVEDRLLVLEKQHGIHHP